MDQRILIVGSVAIDDIKTPTEERRRVLGGSCTFGSVAAANFAPVDIVGVVGDDFEQSHVDTLQARGIDTRGLEVVPGGETFHWGGEYRGELDDRITHFTELGVFEQFDPKLPDTYRGDRYVFLANIDPALQLSVLGQVESPKLVLIDSMNLWIETKREVLMEALARADVALLNDAEARMLFDTDSVPKAAERLLEIGLKRAIIKKGSNGAQMFSPEGTFAVPALPLAEVRDPTGAGDTFAGGLIGYLAMRDRIDETVFRQAILVGSACASFVVQDFSIGRTAGLTPGEIEVRCAQLHAAIQCEPVRL